MSGITKQGDVIQIPGRKGVTIYLRVFVYHFGISDQLRCHQKIKLSEIFWYLAIFSLVYPVLARHFLC